MQAQNLVAGKHSVKGKNVMRVFVGRAKTELHLAGGQVLRLTNRVEVAARPARDRAGKFTRELLFVAMYELAGVPMVRTCLTMAETDSLRGAQAGFNSSLANSDNGYSGLILELL